jgi:cytochrome c oxidase subunit IV
MSTFDKFEEYKLFIEDTARFSERRQKVGSTYVAVNSIILSAIAFLVKDSGFTGRWQLLVVLPLLAAGITICLSWRQLILNYKKLVNLRIDRLRAMEEQKVMVGSSKIYHAEDELYPRDDEGELEPGKGLNFSSKGLNFSDLEQQLPWVFLWLYAIFLVGVVALIVRP